MIHNNPGSLKETRISFPSPSLLIHAYQSVISLPPPTHTLTHTHTNPSLLTLWLPSICVPSSSISSPLVHMHGVVKHLVIYGALIWSRPIHCFVACSAVGCPADSNFPPVGEDCVSWANGILNPHLPYQLWRRKEVCFSLRGGVGNRISQEWRCRKQTAVSIYSANCT